MAEQTYKSETIEATGTQTPSFKGEDKPIGQKVDELLKRVVDHATKIEKQETLVFLGFIILLVMVATMLIAVLALFISVLKNNTPSNNYSNPIQYQQQQRW
jgi:hypothetical protein